MEYKKLSIDKIELDLNNPRIKQWIEIYGDDVTSEGIALALSASNGGETTSSYSSLKESIRVNQGIINPIIVNKQSDGRMIVIEGNTRLQIYKEFAKLDPKGPWKQIIAIVYDDLCKERIHAIRLQTHLVGPRDWDPFSKAKYLNQLCNIDKLPINTIISFCGGKRTEIIKLIEAYNDMTQHYLKKANDASIELDPREFSKFVELQNRSIINSLLMHKFTKDDFADWVLKGNIDTAQNVRKLPSILDDPIASTEFIKSNISEAVKYLSTNERNNKVLSSIPLNDLVIELTKRIINIEYKTVKDLRNDPRYEEQKLNIIDLLEQLKTFVKDIEGE